MDTNLSTHICHGRNQFSHHDRMDQPLHLTMEETNHLTMTKRLWDSSLSLRGNLDLEKTKLLPEVLKLHSGQWLHQHIIYLIICQIETGSQVNMSRIYQKLAQCVHNKENIWSCVHQVHQGPNHTTIHRSINRL